MQIAILERGKCSNVKCIGVRLVCGCPGACRGKWKQKGERSAPLRSHGMLLVNYKYDQRNSEGKGFADDDTVSTRCFSIVNIVLIWNLAINMGLNTAFFVCKN